MFGWFKKRHDTPIEQRGYGKLYAGLAGLLFLGTFLAVYNEIDSRRPWKDYQETFRALKARVLTLQLRSARDLVGKDALKAIDARIAKLNANLEHGEASKYQAQVDDIATEIRDVSQERANLKAEADNRNYGFEHGRREGHIEASDAKKRERTEFEQQMVVLDKVIDSLNNARAAIVQRHLTPIHEELKSLENQRDSIYGTVETLMTKLDENNDMPIKVKQIMIADMDKSNFGNVKMRVDRCQSCHLGISDPVFADSTLFTEVGPGKVFKTKEMAAKYRKVFGPHPYPEVLKAHDVEKFGCTSCHQGQPMSIDDVDHAHGLEAHWETPLLRGQFVQGACRNCHQGNYNYSGLQTVADGRKLFVDFGCFGCHEGPNVPDFKEYKVGPSLMRIASKVTPQWTFNWIKNPQAWNEHTRMPNFEFDDEQTAAVVAYLYDKTKNSDYKPVAATAPAGDPARGAQTLKEVGCIACHAIDEYEPVGGFTFKPASGKNSLWQNTASTGDRVAEGNNFGPDLNKIGSKVSAAWLYDWVRNPKHYMPTSRMPSLRLSDGEAADITAYLMTKRDPSYPTTAPLGNMSDAKLVERGGALIREYGCFGCHHIPGMENEGKVSVPLDDFGLKTEADLFFGYRTTQELYGVREHFEKSPYKLGRVYQHINRGEDWFNWTILKLKNPRTYATDAIPQKMPSFNMTDEEAYALTVLLRSYTKKRYVPATFRDPGGEFTSPVYDGRFLVHWNNCVGCHRIEGEGGHVIPFIGKQMGLEGDDALPYGPPNLNTVGVKTQENWFFNFIRDPSSSPVRPWLKIRMPTYGFEPSEITRLDKYFLGLEKHTLQFTDYSYYPASQGTIDAGRQIFVALDCQKCHPVGSAGATGGAAAVPAPNLTLAGNRLNPEWIVRWLREPAAISPGTKMPSFFGTIDSNFAAVPGILNGDWKAQVNALRDYVWRLGGPKGFLRDGRMSDSAQAAPPATTPVVNAATNGQPSTRDSGTRGRVSMR